MIAGFDHLSMSIHHTEGESDALLEMGYQIRFSERNVHNHREKEALIEEFEPLHDLIYLQHENGFRLELTRYASSPRTTEAAFSVDLDQPGEITLETALFEEDIEFLSKALRFRVTSSTDQEAELLFRSPVAGWSCSLKVIRTPEKSRKSYLDSNGFPCLAFISTSLQKDSEKLRILGAVEMTTPFSLCIDGKPLTIVMFRFPGGAIGELIEIDNKATVKS